MCIQGASVKLWQHCPLGQDGEHFLSNFKIETYVYMLSLSILPWLHSHIRYSRRNQTFIRIIYFLSSIRRLKDKKKEDCTYYMKLKLSLCMPWRRMWEWINSSLILNLGIVWRWLISFTPCPIYHQGRSTSTYINRGGWVYPIARFDALEKRWILCPCW